MQNIRYILNDIELAIENKAYLSALALALTLPDICGQIAYPDIEDDCEVGKRYMKWLRDTIYGKNFKKYSDVKCWNGKDMAAIIYELRCNFLHSGETVKNKIFTDKDGVKIRYYFELNVWKHDNNKFHMINGCDSFGGCELVEGNKIKEKNYEIKLNIVELCKRLSGAAKVFFDKNINNPAWEDKNINIFYKEKVETKYGGEYYKDTNYPNLQLKLPQD